MILFINSENQLHEVVPYKKLADINIIEINFHNKAVLKNNMLELIMNFMDALSTEEEKFLLVINDLDDALMNLDNLSDDMANIKRSMFKTLLETFIQMGHEIVYYTYKGDSVNSYVLEYDELDGFQIIDDEVKLYNKLIKDIK